MKAKTAGKLFGLSLMAILAGTAAALDAPQLHPGAVWTYRIVDYFKHRETGSQTRTAVSSNEIRIETRLDENRRADVRIFAAPGAMSEGSLSERARGRMEPPLQLLVYPLEEGRQWKQTVTRIDNGGRHEMRLQAKVLGWEQIKVPAGEFRALKVERLLFMGDGDAFRGETKRTEVEWYAPGIAMPVRAQVFDEFHFYRDRVLSPYTPGDWLIYELTAYK